MILLDHLSEYVGFVLDLLGKEKPLIPENFNRAKFLLSLATCHFLFSKKSQKDFFLKTLPIESIKDLTDPVFNNVEAFVEEVYHIDDFKEFLKIIKPVVKDPTEIKFIFQDREKDIILLILESKAYWFEYRPILNNEEFCEYSLVDNYEIKAFLTSRDFVHSLKEVCQLLV
jgi:hypothetical protein